MTLNLSGLCAQIWSVVRTTQLQSRVQQLNAELQGVMKFIGLENGIDLDELADLVGVECNCRCVRVCGLNGVCTWSCLRCRLDRLTEKSVQMSRPRIECDSSALHNQQRSINRKCATTVSATNCVSGL